MEDWQKEISGLIIGRGKYTEAAKIAFDHGIEGVQFAMQYAFTDGFNDAVKEITGAAYEAKKKALRSTARYDWSRAPDWVKWAATDNDGQVWWYDGSEPWAEDSSGMWCTSGTNCRMAYNVQPSPDWKESLEKRPEWL